MEETRTVSIIIPSCNSALTIERAVRSVLAQTYTDIELIVVDDGSEDETASLVEAIAGEDQRVRLLLKPRAGVSAARNDGIMSATGEWFMTLDADDFLEPEAVSRLLDVALSSDADLVMCGVRLVYPDGSRKTYSVPYDYTDEKGDFLSNLFAELYDRLLITTHSNKIYRSRIAWEHEIYYEPLLAVHEDIDFVLRFMRHCANIGVVDGAYLNYTQHPAGESLIGTFRPYAVAGSLLVLRDMDALFGDIFVTNRTIEAANLRLFWHILSYVGIMYRQSGYSDLRKLIELKELAEREDFRKLLRDLVPDSPKTAVAKILLGLRLYGVYHFVARLLYRANAKAAEAPEAAPDILIELARVPYRELGLLSAEPEDEPGPEEEPEPEPEPEEEPEPEPEPEEEPEPEPDEKPITAGELSAARKKLKNHNAST